MIITVTQEDIDKGKTSSVVSCPIALAVKRTCKLDDGVEVLEDEIILKRRDLQRWLPAEAINFIRRFDDFGSEGVAPFSFEIEDIP